MTRNLRLIIQIGVVACFLFFIVFVVLNFKDGSRQATSGPENNRSYLPIVPPFSPTYNSQKESAPNASPSQQVQQGKTTPNSQPQNEVPAITSLPPDPINPEEELPSPSQTSPLVESPASLSSPSSTTSSSSASSASAASAAATVEILPLPEVTPGELTIGSNGASDFSSYMEQLIKLGQNISFPVEKYSSIKRDQNKVPLSPDGLVGLVLSNGTNFDDIKASLTITRELSDYKIGKLRGIQVQGEAIAINQMVIGFEKLTEELIDKTIATGEGRTSLEALRNYYQRYDATAFYYYKKIKSMAAIQASAGDKVGFLGKLADSLGLRKIAEAIFITQPFGGRITFIAPCLCEAGLAIHVGLPRPGIFLVSTFTSIIFAHYTPIISNWVLGNYAPISICTEPNPAVVFGVPPCPGIPVDLPIGTVTIMGTSLIP